MKKFILSLLVVAGFGAYALHQQTDSSQKDNVVPLTSSDTSPSTPNDSTQPIPQSSTATNPKLGYKDGQYTGDVTDAFYGNVQVKLTISSGKISQVDFLQYPNDRRTSIEINTQAMPYLRQEAISAQSANVDIVSGATQTSLAFRTSLKSALDKAVS